MEEKLMEKLFVVDKKKIRQVKRFLTDNDILFDIKRNHRIFFVKIFASYSSLNRISEQIKEIIS